MTQQQMTAFFGDWEELWRRKDAAGLAASHTERGVVISPMFATVQGRTAIEASYRDIFTAFTDVEVAIEELIVEGDRAAMAYRSSATHVKDFFGLPGSGKRFDIQGVFLSRFEDGKIAHQRRVYDFTSLLIQLGVLKAKPR